MECGSHATAFEGASMACALHTLTYENVEISVRMTIGDHPTLQVPNVCVSELDQSACGNGAHALAAAIDNQLCALFGGQLIQVPLVMLLSMSRLHG